MTVSTDDVIARFRTEVDDIVRGTDGVPGNDALWSNIEVLNYLDEAVTQTATEIRSLYNTFTISYAAVDGPYIPLPTTYEVLDIYEVYLVGRRRLLSEHNATDGMRHQNDYGFYGGNEGWEVATGIPTRYTRDFRPGFLRLYPAPTEDDVLQITAIVGVGTMTLAMAMPFQHPKDIRLVITWMKHLAYGKKDVDTFDADATNRYRTQFDRDALDRRYECQRIRRAPSATKFSW